MKKISTLILLFLVLFSKPSVSQTNECNAEFNIAFQNSNTVQFNPVMSTVLASIQHNWLFGDGNSSNMILPVHTYSTVGTYTARHIVIRFSNNAEICRDTFYRVIHIQAPASCILVANFIPSPVTGSPNTFHFQNTSTPLAATDSIRWTFGDGTSSNQFSPNHTYAQPGTYNVCLRVQKRNSNGELLNCIREICHTVIVQGTTPAPCNLVAGFIPSPVLNTPNTFHFQNTSAPLTVTDSIRWTFGDGTSSNQFSPNHTYAQPGTYNVCLRVQKRNSAGVLLNCVREICHIVIVQATTPAPCNLVANFIPSPVLNATNTFHFQNTSTPLSPTDSIRWTFGDGSSSNQVSPNHAYAQPGIYNVCLRVQKRNSAGVLLNCVREICHTIIVQGTTPTPCNLVANFIPSPVIGALNTFHFQNTSTPLTVTDSIRWTFGDGTSSNQVSPNHTYTQPGTYNVCLRVQKRNSAGVLLNCVREICHVVVVQGTTPFPCNLVAGFIFSMVTGSPYTYHFQNTSLPLNPTDSIRWTFGDGTSSNQASPDHTYAHSGVYTVCLRVQKRNSNGELLNCVREICHTVVAGPTTNICNLQPYPNPATTFISVNVFLGQAQMIDVYIYNTSNLLVREGHHQGTVGNNTITLMTGDLVSGIYIMKVVRGNSICYAQFVKL